MAASGLSICLAYPNTYPVGMANFGFQAVYGILGRAGVAGERAFPSEDCGGPSGYERILRFLGDGHRRLPRGWRYA